MRVPYPYSLQHLLFSVFFILVAVFLFNVALICISLVVNDVRHFFFHVCTGPLYVLFEEMSKILQFDLCIHIVLMSI